MAHPGHTVVRCHSRGFPRASVRGFSGSPRVLHRPHNPRCIPGDQPFICSGVRHLSGQGLAGRHISALSHTSPSSPTKTGGYISKTAHSQDCFLCSSAVPLWGVCVCVCVHAHTTLLLPFSVPTSLLLTPPLWAPGHSTAPKLMDFCYPCLPRTPRKERSKVTFQKCSPSSLWSSSS